MSRDTMALNVLYEVRHGDWIKKMMKTTGHNGVVWVKSRLWLQQWWEELKGLGEDMDYGCGDGDGDGDGYGIGG